MLPFSYVTFLVTQSRANFVEDALHMDLVSPVADYGVYFVHSYSRRLTILESVFSYVLRISGLYSAYTFLFILNNSGDEGTKTEERPLLESGDSKVVWILSVP